MKSTLVRFQVFATGLLVTTFAGFAGCSNDSLDPENPGVDSIAVTPRSSTLLVGTSVALTAQAMGVGGNEIPSVKVVWASENAAIATVSQLGVVTGVRPGSVKISASSWGKDAVASVSVNPLSRVISAVDRIVIAPPNPRIREGETLQLNATALDKDDRIIPGLTMVWGSSNTNRVTVSQTGLIRGVNDGNASITASGGGKTASLNVRVDRRDDDREDDERDDDDDERDRRGRGAGGGR